MERHFKIACAFALALHAPLVVAAALDSPPRSDSRRVIADVDIDLEPSPVSVPAANAEPTPTPRVSTSEVVGVRGSAPARAGSPNIVSVASRDPGSASTDVERAPDKPTPTPAVVLTLPATSLDLPPAYALGRARDESGTAGASAEAAMRSALDERDRSAGLARSGPIASAIHAVAGGGRLTPGSSATIVATVDEHGAVVGVAIARSSGDAAAWQEIADALLVAMRGKQIVVPKGAHGLRLGFAVESRVRRAGGHMKNGRTPVFVTADDAKASRSPSIALGTPVYRCLEGCTASANLDPTDAVLNATQDDARTIVVESLPSERIP